MIRGLDMVRLKYFLNIDRLTSFQTNLLKFLNPCITNCKRIIFAVRYKPGYRPYVSREGKSGQHRAMHPENIGASTSVERDSATENNYPGVNREKGENVR